MEAGNEYLIIALLAVWRLLEWVVKKRGVNVDKMIEEMHPIVTAQTDTGAKKVWTPERPIRELREAVEAIDVKQLERTHKNVNLIHEQISTIVKILNDIDNQLEGRHGR